MVTRLTRIARLSIFVSLVLFPLSAFALTIDDFKGSQSATAIGAGDTDQDSVSTTGAIGGTRSIIVDNIEGSLRAQVEVGLDVLSHSQDAGVKGQSLMIWDGDISSSIDYDGLGGIDFTQDGGDSVEIGVLEFDPGVGGEPIDMTLTFYDASDTTGNTYWTATHTFNSSVSNATITIAYADFIASGGSADFTNVGAITLFFDGDDTAVDITLTKIKTNGECELVPDDNGKVIDECGVCGGDNSSCTDCLGVINGTAIEGTTCNTGEPGVCEIGEFNVNCECVPDENPSGEICDGKDNDCDGEIDEIFPDLGGDCSYGTGLCAVEGEYVCDENGGLICDADSQKPQYEECEENKGCDEVPYSGKVEDICGICDGDGKSCLDCAGTPFGTAELDRCEVCEGDGDSCIECETDDLYTLLKSLDGGAKRQERLIKQAMRRLRKVSKTAKTARFAKKNSQIANTLQVTNWTLSWTVPRFNTQCTHSEFCATTSNEDILAEYRVNSEALRKIGQKVLRRLRKARGGALNKGEKLLARKINKRHDENMSLADTVPLVNVFCN